MWPILFDLWPVDINLWSMHHEIVSHYYKFSHDLTFSKVTFGYKLCILLFTYYLHDDKLTQFISDTQLNWSQTLFIQTQS